MFNEKGFPLLIKGVLISVAFSLFCVLILAMLGAIFSISETVISIITVIIKVLAVLIGVFIAVSGEKGLLKGAFYGLIIIAVNYVLFSIIGGGFSFTLKVLWELLLGLTVGAVAGIIAVNLKKKA